MTMAYNEANSNNTAEYLDTVNFKAHKKTGKGKGTVDEGNYGSRAGDDNQIYSDRGMKDPDDAKLKSQNMPNNRMYSYME